MTTTGETEYSIAIVSFSQKLADHGLPALARKAPSTVQLNVGKLCNQACHHCHVEAGPKRTEIMTAATADRLLELLAASTCVRTVDFTGGAPELNREFVRMVEGAHELGMEILVRCNLTVLYEEAMEHLPVLYTANRVKLVCSLPCYTAENVDSQRGIGVFDKSIEGLRLLNGLGYGTAGSGLDLDLVYNPLGAFLPPAQAELEAKYREELLELFGIRFNQLLTITNMPVKRFAEMLERRGETEQYMGLLVNHFNPATVDGLMCRDMVSVGWEGSLYDCDFNQMLEMPLTTGGQSRTIDNINSFDELGGTPIQTANHCFGCTAGSGSSCGGTLS